MDYKELLTKYMRLVRDCEGETFIYTLREWAGYGWPEAEIAALEEIEASLGEMRLPP